MPDPVLLSAFILFMIGFTGSLAAEVLLLYKSRARFLGIGIMAFLSLARRNFGYLVATLFMNIAGGVVVLLYVYSGFKLNAMLAFHVGASAPLFITKFATVAPDPIRSDIQV